jgi:hypothetical protein
MISLLFWCLMLLCCLLAIAIAGKDGRIAAGMILIAVMLTQGAQQASMNWRSVNVGVMLVDIALFIALIALMLRSSNFWPIWVAASQGLAVGSHLVTLMVSQFDPKIYAAIATGSSVICLLCMTIGAILDRFAGGAPSAYYQSEGVAPFAASRR